VLDCDRDDQVEFFQQFKAALASTMLLKDSSLPWSWRALAMQGSWSCG